MSNSNRGGFAFGPPNAFTGGNAFAFSGGNAFAFGASGGAGGIDLYGFSGFPGNPMLVAGLTGTREAVLRSLRPQPGAGRTYGDPADRGGPTVMPPFDNPAHVGRWGTAPRGALAQLELMSRIQCFSPTPGTMKAQVALTAGGSADLLSIECPPWPYFLNQLSLVDRDAVQRDTRVAEILTQVTTPLSYFATILNMQAGRHPHTSELIDAGLRFVYAMGMRFKHAFAVPRPSDASALIQPIIEVPQHSAFPMGHATEGHFIAGLLIRLVPGLAAPTGDWARQALRRTAFRIAENRVIAGVHYPVDGLAGRLLGDTLACFVAAVCSPAPSTCPVGRFVTPAADDAEMLVHDAEFGGAGCSTTGTLTPLSSPILQQMWAAARSEWM